METKKLLRRMLTLLLGITVFFVLCNCNYASKIKTGAKAEWDNAKTILVHIPGASDFWPSIFPIGPSFATPFNCEKAHDELLNYVKVLENNGVKVYKLDDVLLSGTVDKKGNAIQGKELTELQKLAGDFLKIDTKEVKTKTKIDFKKYKRKVLKTLSPQMLLKIILLDPTIHLIQRNTATGLDCKYSIVPLMNMYFLRDQSITTGKGIVLGKFTNPQRTRETKVINFAFYKMGIKPIYEVKGAGRLEGGDFYMAGNLAFIGNGLRTNMKAIKQLFRHNAIGVDKVAVVKDHLRIQSQMHLDTYFNIVGPKLAVLASNRMRMKGQKTDAKAMSTVDVYELKNGKYVLTEKNRDFQDYLENVLGYKLIPVPMADMKQFGPNFLTIAPYKIIGVKGVSKAYQDALKKAGVSATWLDMNNIIAGYGAAHCTTQVMYRDNN